MATYTSSVAYTNFTSSYSAEWYTYTDSSGTPYVYFTLRYVGYDISAWST